MICTILICCALIGPARGEERLPNGSPGRFFGVRVGQEEGGARCRSPRSARPLV